MDEEEEPSEQDPEMAEEFKGMGIDLDGPGREEDPRAEDAPEQDFIVPERQRTEEIIQERLRATRRRIAPFTLSTSERPRTSWTRKSTRVLRPISVCFRKTRSKICNRR